MNKGWIFLAAGLVLAVSAGTFITKTILKQQHGEMSAPAKKGTYQCAMHPTIVSDKPGICPICNMKLQLVDEVSPSASTTASSQAASKERKVISYRHPMRADVTSSVPAKDEMGMDYIPVYEDDVSGGESAIPGHAAFGISQERQQLIGVKTARVQQMDLDVEIRTVGKIAYDPELYNAMVEYREAVLAKEKIKDSPSPDAHERAEALVKSAALKLRVIGIPEETIHQVAKDNPDLTSLLLPGKKVWVYAQVYEYEVDLLKPGQSAVVTAPSMPGRVYHGKIVAIDPVLNATTRSVRVRAEIETPESRLRPESFVHVKFQMPLGRKLAIPEDAVLDTGEHQVVFVKQGEGRFEPRGVILGRETQGQYEILSGLEEGEEVVTSANFLIDSESRFRSALKTFKGKKAGSQPH